MFMFASLSVMALLADTFSEMETREKVWSAFDDETVNLDS